MTPDQMRVFEKAFGEAARHVNNLSLMIFDPSRDQAEHLDDLLETLVCPDRGNPLPVGRPLGAYLCQNQVQRKNIGQSRLS
jgi:hypothetical protein